jgi:hypothetical protein
VSTPASANNQSDHKLKIADGEVFQQSVAVARLAVELWKASKTSNVKLIEKASPKDFLADAWELIESARGISMRPATPVEYMAQGDGSWEELAQALSHVAEPNVSFELLCDPERKGGATEPIEVFDAESGKRIEVEWKVYRSPQAFDNLFRRYWCDIGEKWKRGDPKIGTMPELDIAGKPLLDKNGKPRRINYEPQRYRIILKALVGVPHAWKDYGKDVLKRWKQNGVPLGDFLALAEFRRSQDKRAANLKRPKKRRVAKSRTRQRNVRARGQNGRTQRQER